MNYAATILEAICNNQIRKAEIMLHQLTRIDSVLVGHNGNRTVTFRPARWLYDYLYAPAYLHNPQEAVTLVREVAYETSAFEADKLLQTSLRTFAEASPQYIGWPLDFNRRMAQLIIVDMLKKLTADN